MMTRKHRPGVGPVLLVTIACSLAVVGVLWTSVPAAQAGLPPRPTSQAQPKPDSPLSARITLLLQFPADWPWADAHWQTLCTVVQWQDGWGNWHVVEGWRGALDDVAVSGAGEVSGYKTWWVAKKDYGTGPFRWVITQGLDGTLLATSESFHLPDVNMTTVAVRVLLE
ncbi:MAG: hypothetical protein MUQ30_17100 [Anaerolineae bacterium]|nr:hypothetical protein [Anaerolineae bacterium]